MLTFFMSCRTGYQKKNGMWVWVTYDESAGKRLKYMEGCDNSSFRVLADKNYGKDKNTVFYMGRNIKGADPNTFEVIDDRGYSKDAKHVFVDCERVIFADPGSFQVLEFPYARDENHIYCGTLPMNIHKNEIVEFKVTNTDKLMAGTKTTTKLSHFIEYNPAYSWLDTLGIEWVVVGAWGTGETKRRKFKGLDEVDLNK